MAKSESKANKTKEKVADQNTGEQQKTDDSIEANVERKLVALYSLQKIDTQIDKIRSIRGELPLEVEDLEDEIVGLETRINNYQEKIGEMDNAISEKNNAKKESESLIAKYNEQIKNVRNNREYESLSKEIEFQTLESQLADKRIKEYTEQKEETQSRIDETQKLLDERRNDLDIKKKELKDIVAETEKEENNLIKKSEEHQEIIEDRLLTAYKRIRKNARNGLAVVPIERDACGGCFNKIPPQRQLDIKMHKKIIVCEYCGRILIDDNIAEKVSIN
ncbi:MAG: hypothetical protein K9I94_01785 [Bacteroidales bacterium]|nr:hypothetical protein [Bacteroidales bacterium]